MELHIKNNYAPNIEVKDGGTLNLYQDRNGQWRQRLDNEDIVDAEVIEEMHEDEHRTVNSPKLQADEIRLSDKRQRIIERIMVLVDKGDWMNDHVADGVKEMMENVFTHSEELWQLLENGRGDRVQIVWSNIVGYLSDRQLLKPKGSPALCKDFFGKTEGYANIDKGRPSGGNMSDGFRKVLSLLDAYAPKIDKKA